MRIIPMASAVRTVQRTSKCVQQFSKAEELKEGIWFTLGARRRLSAWALHSLARIA